MKQPAWETMPVLDVRGLLPEQLSPLEAAYDEISKRPLAPLAQLAHDPERQKIDDAISAALSLPTFNPVRELLAREPGLTAREINPKTTLEAEGVEDEAALRPPAFQFEESISDRHGRP